MQLIASIVDHWGMTLFVVAALACLAWNGFNRAKWDVAWSQAGNDQIAIPEKRWQGYDAHDLDEFKTAAGRAGMLRFYVHAILRGSDIFFAIALSGLTAWLWYLIATAHLDCVWLNWAAWPFGAMAILYGVADVAEDLKLSTILNHDGPADVAETAAVSTLTRVKIVTLSVSLIGGGLFLIYGIGESLTARLMRSRQQRQRA